MTVIAPGYYTGSLLWYIVDSMFKTFQFAWQGLKLWQTRQILVALGTALVVGLLIGYATVLIPNSFFTRDIPPVWWNYPVWILTSIVSGMLAATYVRAADPEPAAKDRHGKFGMVGGFLAWFAVGCPVCNKIALLAFGYSGAITYFAPIQPILGIAALLLTGAALIWRLKGQVVCSTPRATWNPSGVQVESEARI